MNTIEYVSEGNWMEVTPEEFDHNHTSDEYRWTGTNPERWVSPEEINAAYTEFDAAEDSQITLKEILGDLKVARGRYERQNKLVELKPAAALQISADLYVLLNDAINKAENAMQLAQTQAQAVRNKLNKLEGVEDWETEEVK